MPTKKSAQQISQIYHLAITFWLYYIPQRQIQNQLTETQIW